MDTGQSDLGSCRSTKKNLKVKTSDSIGLERRNKRHGAPGGTGRLVACSLAGGASNWLGWVTARRRA
jgi:hypothetical protein